MACVAVREIIPVIALLVIDIGRRATGRGLHVVRELASRNPVRGRTIDGMAPVGRDQSAVGVDDAECRGEAANHSAGSVWETGILVSAHQEHVIIRGRQYELQDDLVCPLPCVVGENLVSVRILSIPPDLDAVIELLPELERN